MSDTEVIQKLSLEKIRLQNENDELKAKLAELEQEHLLVVRTIIKTLNAVGLWPIKEGDNLATKALKEVSQIIFKSTINPGAIEKQFDFVKEIYPLCEKYKDVQI
jgi:UDP-N-acetyl-D-mannosaminuronate dehydrogenase